jgi:hypothetical protein
MPNTTMLSEVIKLKSLLSEKERKVQILEKRLKVNFFFSTLNYRCLGKTCLQMSSKLLNFRGAE